MAKLQGLQKRLPSHQHRLVNRMLVFDRAMYSFIRGKHKSTLNSSLLYTDTLVELTIPITTASMPFQISQQMQEPLA